MLVVAGKIVQPLVWPALLVGLVVCMKVYWVALLWRRRGLSRRSGLDNTTWQPQNTPQAVGRPPANTSFTT